MPSGFKRWLVFNAVGAMGIAVQLTVLGILATWADLNYLLATGLAVESAVLHNFFWHEHWTWADRREGPSTFFWRFLGFHLANGLFSLGGNLVFMRFFAGGLGIDLMAANMLAITLCSVLNFFAGDRLVYRDSGNRGTGSACAPAVFSQPFAGLNRNPSTGGSGMKPFPLITLFFILGTAGAYAADLQPETLRAWNATIEKTEQRMAAELNAGNGFLSLDFQDTAAAAKERQRVMSGEISIDQVRSVNSRIPVPSGMIHHWKGAVFIPGVNLDLVLSRVANPRLEDSKQEDVLESKVLENRPGQLKLYLKLQRSKIVTVVYNTEHLVQYKRHGRTQASSSSIATKISELDYGSDGTEREKPEGHDHGYLWRMNSYWRYQETKGGVIVECESLTLSRSIPGFLEYMVRPLIRSVARESMKRTLESLRVRMLRTREYSAGLRRLP